MSNCKKCGEFFQPSPDEERMIATKRIEEICLKCAMLLADASNMYEDYKPPPMRIPIGKYDGTKLHRAIKFDSAGNPICFTALPAVPLKALHDSLRKPRKGVIHVGIISDSDSQRMTSQPNVILHTNIDSFISSRNAFWVKKVPDFWDRQTGVSRIEVPFKDVSEVTINPQEKDVMLKDGGLIKLIYK